MVKWVKTKSEQKLRRSISLNCPNFGRTVPKIWFVFVHVPTFSRWPGGYTRRSLHNLWRGVTSIQKVPHLWRKSRFSETSFSILLLHQLRGMDAQCNNQHVLSNDLSDVIVVISMYRVYRKSRIYGGNHAFRRLPSQFFYCIS